MDIKKHILNERIRAKEVRLIDENGKQVGVVSIQAALTQAQETGLDLLLVSEAATPPVCKLVNYGQYKYQLRKKEKQARRITKAQVVKELKMRPRISEHDFQVRVNRGIEFLQKGHKIKLTIAFRGREIIHPELGRQVLDRYLVAVKEIGSIEGSVISSNRMLFASINPKAK